MYLKSNKKLKNLSWKIWHLKKSSENLNKSLIIYPWFTPNLPSCSSSFHFRNSSLYLKTRLRNVSFFVETETTTFCIFNLSKTLTSRVQEAKTKTVHSWFSNDNWKKWLLNLDLQTSFQQRVSLAGHSWSPFTSSL